MEFRFKKELDLYKKINELNESNLSEFDIEKLPIKYGVRVVVIVESNYVILIKNNEGYHTLVGGHIEDRESLENCAIRESLEESGYDISNLKPLGYIMHLNNKRKKFDFGFLAKVEGEPKEVNLTEEEIKEGHIVTKYLIDEAIKILSNDAIKFNKSISLRSAIFIGEAKNMIK